MASHPWRDDDTLHELYVEQKLSTVQIGEQLGCSPSTVNRWLSKHGIEVRSVGESNVLRLREGTDGERDRVRELYDQGESPPQIAEKIDRHVQTVRSWIDQMGIKDDSVVCPTCGDGFPNENGMKVHHAKTHGESIQGIPKTCDYCGTEYRGRNRSEADLEHSFCSQNCAGDWQSENRVGESHPSYNRVTVECSNCGVEFEKKACYAGEHDHHFCDDDCRGEWLTGQRRSDDWWVEFECQNCGETAEKTRLQYEQVENHFCGVECYREWAKENMSGENSPQWNGGYENYYGPSWREQRRKARERANYACERCGVTQEELGQVPDCHHIERFGNYGSENHEEANRLDNLILLCRSCHKKYDHLPIRPVR